MAKRKKKAKDKTESPQAQAEAKKDSALPDEFSNPAYLIEYVKTRKKEADDAARERRIKWAELWQLFQSKQDYTGKQSWQSKIFTPKIFTHTIRAAALVERAVLQTATLFKVEIDAEAYKESEYKEAREKARKVEKKIKSHLEQSNFADSYGEGAISGLLLGLGCDKRLWDEEVTSCHYENTDVLNLWIDPAFMPFVHRRPGYIIERKVEKLAVLLDKVAKNKDNYITDAVDKLEAGFAIKQEIAIKERTRRGLSQHSAKDKPLELLEFWGDVISKDGKHILKDQLLIIANETELIRHHENPFNDKLPPYRLKVAVPYPHRGIAGVSLVEGAVPLQYTLNNLLNLYMDNLNFTVNKMYEVYKGGLVDQQKARRIYPGKIFLKSTDQRVVTEVNTTPIGMEIINAVKVIDSELRQATAITEYVEALPSKHKQTLGEIEKKTTESHSFFDVIARRLERTSIGPLIKDTYNLLVQFSETLKGLEGEYIFKVGGLSLLLQEEKLRAAIEKILVAALGNEVLSQLTNIPVLWKKMLTQMNLQDAYQEPEEQQEALPGAAGAKTPEAATQKAKEDFRKLPPEGQMRLLRTVA